MKTPEDYGREVRELWGCELGDTSLADGLEEDIALTVRDAVNEATAGRMNRKWLLIVADMLGRAADEAADGERSYWTFPHGWTDAERREFIAALRADNGTPGEWDGEDGHLFVPDWWVMRFLANRLRAEVNA